jgi:hypothetical protein
MNEPEERVVHDTKLPRFISFSQPGKYVLKPTLIQDLGTRLIIGRLITSWKITSFIIKVNVTNKAPYLMIGFIPNWIVLINTKSHFNLSKILDQEKHQVKINVFN